VRYAIVLLAACTTPLDLDGHYRVDSYTRNPSSCTATGDEIARPFPAFEIAARSFAGVTIYPAYACDDAGRCAADNDAMWSLVVVEDDLDQVEITSAASAGAGCALRSEELVIAAAGAGVVLAHRTLEVQIEPYDPRTCTTENAAAQRARMTCVSLVHLVGNP
jgi:hypothetical protein